MIRAYSVEAASAEEAIANVRGYPGVTAESEYEVLSDVADVQRMNAERRKWRKQQVTVRATNCLPPEIKSFCTRDTVI
jgi:hypothetical protein